MTATAAAEPGALRVLVVEDDPAIADSLVRGLRQVGYDADGVGTARAALTRPPSDVVLLDLGLPDMDGVELCRRLRQRSDPAIIVVTARGEEADRVLALDEGADDYLVKPFDIGELLARMHAVLRRRAPVPALADPAEVVVVADVRVDLARHDVSVAGQPVALTRKEFQILALLAAARGTVVTRGRIVAEVWGRSWAGANRTLDVHVATLRTKLGRPELVATVRGVGYRIEVPEAVNSVGPDVPGPEAVPGSAAEQ